MPDLHETGLSGQKEIEHKRMIRKGLAGGSYKPLSPEAIVRINETVLQIIEEIGCEVNSEIALESLEKIGASVDKQQHRVRISREKVLELINNAPSEVRLWT